MKKLICILLAAVLLLAGCGSKEGDTAGNTGNDSKTVSENGSGSIAEANDPGEETSSAGDSKGTNSIFPQTLYADESIEITAKSLFTEDAYGPGLDISVKNSSEKEITVQSSHTVVNGYMTEALFSVNVKPGISEETQCSFSEEELELCGINAIETVDIGFYVFDRESGDILVETELIRLALTEETSQEYNDSGDTLLEEKDLKIRCRGLQEANEDSGPSVLFYIENNTEFALTVMDKDTSVNGIPLSPYFITEVLPGTRCLAAMTFWSSDLSDAGIENVTQICTGLTVAVTDSWEEYASVENFTVEGQDHA